MTVGHGAGALLGIDAGTSAVKAALLAPDGRCLASAGARLEPLHPRPGWSEQDMEEVWAAVAACVRRTLAAAGLAPGEVAAVGCTGQGDGAWMLDRRGRPAGPAILWNDNRAGEQLRRWEASGALAEVYRRTGTLLWPGTQAGIAAWLSEEAPDRLAEVGTIFCCKDWINHRLTGAVATDRTDGSIPFVNLREERRDMRVMEALGLAELAGVLPPLRPSSEVVGAVTAAAAAATGLAEGTPVVTGLLDVAASTLGAGVVGPGRAVLCLGTTSLLCAVLDAPPPEAPLLGATVLSAAPGQWLRILGAQSGTPNLDWVARLLAPAPGEAVPFEALEREAAAAPPGAGGVLYHPYLAGERVPFLAPEATSGFFGITGATAARDLVRAVYEGVALSTRHCLTAADLPVEKLLLVGGGARSGLWSQIVADVTGTPCAAVEGEEHGVRGAALVAGVGVGLYRSYPEAAAQLCREGRRVEPDPGRARRYGELAALYQGLAEQLQGFWRGRAAWLARWGA